MRRPLSHFPDRPRRRGPDAFIAFCGLVVAVIFLAVAALVFTAVFYPETVGQFFRAVVDGYQTPRASAPAHPLPFTGEAGR